MYLISPHKTQYKANLHCHSTLSDGRLSPEELKVAYKQRGYSVLAITDHERPKNHSDLNDDSFLMLTGYEAYIRNNSECRYDVFAPEVHLNLFARVADNETIICYNPCCCKYISPEEQQVLKKAGSEQPREYTTDYINTFIQTANQNGYLVAYNHPTWSMESHQRIISYDGIFSMEIVNGNSNQINRIEYNGVLYDTLLRHNKSWYIHASDDNHNVYAFDAPENDSFLAYTMILAEQLTYVDIIHAMECGEMYASTGPQIHEVSFDGEHIHVRCSDATTIICHNGSKHPPSVYAPNGETITQADFKLHPQSRYARISVIDKNGHTADTRAYSRTEFGWPEL